jgi:hypothetical protein
MAATLRVATRGLDPVAHSTAVCCGGVGGSVATAYQYQGAELQRRPLTRNMPPPLTQRHRTQPEAETESWLGRGG